jgi:tetratricopeptide (TPR) repeat protein
MAPAVPDTPAPAQRSPLRACLLLASVAVAAYFSSFAGTFQFDDWAVIVEDPRVHSLAAWWASMPGIRPLLKLSYALNWQSGFGLTGYHAVNLALHVGNCWLAYALLQRLAGRTLAPRLASRASLAALFAALLFALHPVQTEAVTYISGRSSSLAAFFALASLLTREFAREQPAAIRRTAWLAASLLLFVFALGTKETALVVPIALVLLAACDVRREVRWRDALGPALPHFCVLIVAGYAAAGLPRYWMLLESSFTARDLGVNLLTQLHAVAYLIGQLFMPWRLNSDPTLPLVTAWTPSTAAIALAYAASLAAGAMALRRRPEITFGIFWFFLWLAPTNSLLPRLDLVNDRQLYVALLGPAWLAGCLAVSCAARVAALGRAPRLGLAATGLVILHLLGFATAHRNAVYASEIAFWSDVAAKSPANPRAAGNLGYAYALAGRRVEAEAQFRRALALDPQYTRAAINLMLLKDGSLAP